MNTYRSFTYPCMGACTPHVCINGKNTFRKYYTNRVFKISECTYREHGQDQDGHLEFYQRFYGQIFAKCLLCGHSKVEDKVFEKSNFPIFQGTQRKNMYNRSL